MVFDVIYDTVKTTELRITTNITLTSIELVTHGNYVGQFRYQDTRHNKISNATLRQNCIL